MRGARILATAIVTIAGLVSAGAPVHAQQAEPQSTAPHVRPRIGLVLSGGGARGAAHIGVLKVLDELHVPIDAIAGTSMGAVVGGLYASGMTPKEIEAVVGSLNWQNAFRDRPPRTELDFRRKEEDQKFLVKFPLGIRGGKVQLPKGLVEGQTLNMILRRLTQPVDRITDFNALPTPFRAVATDIANGEPVVMRAGDLATAMRASLSAPGVFAPVERDGRLLVDGGIAENLPIDVVREMNVDILIVVDVGFPLYARQHLGSATQISNQMLAILIRRDSQRQLATLSARDIVVTPALGDVSSFDFSIVPRAVAAGEAATRSALAQLEPLALNADAYSQYLARRATDRSAPPKIDFVQVDPDSQHYATGLHEVFDDLVGTPLDPAILQRRITDFYGRGNLEILDYRLVQQDARYGLDFSARRNSWGPNYVRFGLSLQDDFEGNATYNAAARFVLSELTSKGGEWVFDTQIGESPHIETEVFLPFSQVSPWFIMPHVQYAARNIPKIDPQQNETAEFRVRSFDYGLDFGKQFGNWGEIRAGLIHEEGEEYVRIGNPTEPDLATTHYSDSGYFVRLAYDQIDDTNFPRNGQLATVQWNSEKSQLGDHLPLNQVTLNWLAAHSFGRETLELWVSGGMTLNSTAPNDVRTQFPLGGFLSLSGLAADSLEGPNYGIARLIFYSKIGRGGEGLFDMPVYLGASFEAGNVWQKRSDASWQSLRKDGSIFLGLDTLIGPLYLAAGYDQSGREAFYLFLGRTF